MKAKILTNVSQAYINLHMYEDSLDHCNKALKIDPEFTLALFQKAKSLTHLFKFDESTKLLNKLNTDSNKDLNIESELKVIE